MSSSVQNRSAGRRRGFSFVELLFAVAVMGLGFIMIAAVFPVGLQQTKVSLDETAAAANARGAVANLEQMAGDMVLVSGTLPVTPANGTPFLPVTRDPSAVPTTADVPAGTTRTLPGQVRTFRDPRNFSNTAGNANSSTAIHNDLIWNQIADGMICPSDNRNASVVLFKRDWIATNPPAGSATPFSYVASSTAQLIVINAQAGARSTFDTKDYRNSPALALYNLQPRPVGVTIQQASDGTSIAQFSAVGSTQGFTPTPETNAAPAAVAEGTFVVISDDQILTPAADRGHMNGRIYRVGVQRPDITSGGGGWWQLAPGYDFTTDAGDNGILGDADDISAIGASVGSVTVGNPAVAYILGRGFVDPMVTPTAAAGYTGPTQDVAAYTTFVTVK